MVRTDLAVDEEFGMHLPSVFDLVLMVGYVPG